MVFGFLNIYKPKGITSHDVIGILRRKTGIKQIGHTGTLDPFAQGVLPVCIGKATRLIEYMNCEKEYLATVQFGASTTTFDIEGEILNPLKKEQIVVTEKDIIEALKIFQGEIEQIPPIYSAIKVNGKKLYEYARKGQAVEIKPKKVFIEKIELKEFNPDNLQAKILVKCSQGTYIRSVANDLGKILKTGAYLTELIRTQSGKFRIESSVDLENVNLTSDLLNPLEFLDLPIIKVDNEDLTKIKNGMPLKNNQNNLAGNIILVYNDCEICAVATFQDNLIKLKKVFI